MNYFAFIGSPAVKLLLATLNLAGSPFLKILPF
jgi:hypothetical protein